MRYFKESGERKTGRRSASGQDSMSLSKQEDSWLKDLLKGILVRLSILESKVPQDAIEFERTVASGDTIYLAHHFNSPVRWYVVWWEASSTDTPAFRIVSKTDNSIALYCNCTGTVVVRVEKSQYGVKA